MMNNDSIIFFDSGIGGLPYLEATRELLKNETFHYIADHAFLPYGAKTIPVIRQRVLKVLTHMIDFSAPKACVIACNTATVAALDLMRSSFPDLPFIGVVPAVKPAFEEARKIAVLATGATVANGYLDLLIEQFGFGREVTRIDGNVLVGFVESELNTATEKQIRDFLAPFTDQCVDQGIGALVLGCTHFVHLKKWFEKILPPTVSVIDSVNGVARRTAEIVRSAGLSDKSGETFFYTTSPSFDAAPWVERYNLRFGGVRNI